MHTESTKENWSWAKWIEGFFLLAAAPFLLFPNQFILATIIVLILIAALWLWPILLLRSPLIPKTPFNVTLFLFCCALFVGILVSADRTYTLPKAAGILLGLSTWRYITIYMNQRHLFNRAVAGSILLGFAMTMIGFANADWLLKTTSQVPFLQDIVTRIPFQRIPLSLIESGIHPNEVAGLLMLTLPMSYSLLAGSGPLRKHKFLYLSLAIMAVLSSIILLLTQSRSGWLGLICGIFALLILGSAILPASRMRTTLLVSVGFFLVLAALAVIYWGPTQLAQLWLEPPQETAVGSLATLNFRREIWPWALTAVRDFPFTGTGLGAFRVVAGRLYPISIPETFDFAHAHNVFLQMALDLGIPGLISYISMILLSFVLGWKTAQADARLRLVSIGIMAGLVAFTIFGLTDALAIGSKPTLLLWIMFGLVTSAHQIISTRPY